MHLSLNVSRYGMYIRFIEDTFKRLMLSADPVASTQDGWG